MDTSSNMGIDDPSMYLSPADVMALFNDGGVNMGSLFHPTPVDYTQSTPSHDGMGGRSYNLSSSLGEMHRGPNEEETNSIMGLVSSPP
jgi:hypothetical protein